MLKSRASTHGCQHIVQSSLPAGYDGAMRDPQSIAARWWRTAAEKRSPVCLTSPGRHLPRFTLPTNSGGRRIASATDRRRPPGHGASCARLGRPSAASLPRAPSTDSARPQRSADQRRHGSCGQERNAGQSHDRAGPVTRHPPQRRTRVGPRVGGRPVIRLNTSPIACS